MLSALTAVSQLPQRQHDHHFHLLPFRSPLSALHASSIFDEHLLWLAVVSFSDSFAQTQRPSARRCSLLACLASRCIRTSMQPRQLQQRKMADEGDAPSQVAARTTEI